VFSNYTHLCPDGVSKEQKRVLMMVPYQYVYRQAVLSKCRKRQEKNIGLFFFHDEDMFFIMKRRTGQTAMLMHYFLL
jgi:hypothetical protein